MEPRILTISRDRWVWGGTALACAAMLSAADSQLRLFTGFAWFPVIVDVLVIAAIILFVRDAGEPRAMLADRQAAWAGAALIAIGVIGQTVWAQFIVLPPPAWFTAATFLFEAATLIGLAALAWAVSRSRRIGRAYRNVIVAAVTAIIVSRVVELIVMSTPILSPEFVNPTFWLITASAWTITVFGMLAIALAAILAVHNEPTVDSPPIREPKESHVMSGIS